MRRRCWMLAFAATAAAAMAVEPKVGDIVELEKPTTDGKASVEKVLSTRRSCREWAETPPSLAELGQLAWAGQGVTEPKKGLRAAPSAAESYYLELYAVTPNAAYRYVPAKHAFAATAAGEARAQLAAAAPRMKPLAVAPVVFVFTATFERGKPGWGDVNIRYATIEVGAVMENITLQAEALGMGAVCVGTFKDEDVKKAVGAGEKEQPILMLCVGRRK